MTYLKLNRTTSPGSFNNLFENIFAPGPFLSGETQKLASSNPVSVNILEHAEKFELNIVAPGFVKEQFEINLEQDLLTIKGNVSEQTAAEGVKKIRSEYVPQTFSRSFTVSEQVDKGSISAEYVNGILVVTLLKKTPVVPQVKTINIQ